MKGKFIFIFLTVLAAMISIATFNPIIGLLTRNLGLNEIQSGSLVTVTGICWIAGSFLWGKWAARSRKSIFVCALLAYALSLIAFGFITDRAALHSGGALYWILLGIRAAGGFFYGAIPAIAQGYLISWTNLANRTSGMALFGAANGLGFVLGPAMGALLTPAGLTAPIYVSAVLLIIAAAAGILLLPSGSADTGRGGNTGDKLSPLDSRVRLYLGIGLILSTIMIIMQVTSGFYLQDKLKVTTAESAKMIGIGLSAGGFLVVICQLLITRFLSGRPILLLRAGLPLLGIAFLSFGLFPQYNFISFILFGFGIGFTMPGYTSAASLAVSDKGQGAVASYIAAAQGVGSFLGPVLGTSLYAIDGAYAYSLCVLLALLPAVLVWRLKLPSPLGSSSRTGTPMG